MSDELHVMSLVTLLDAVHTDGVAVCCVTGVTPVGIQIVFVNNCKSEWRGGVILHTMTASANVNYL